MIPARGAGRDWTLVQFRTRAGEDHSWRHAFLTRGVALRPIRVLPAFAAAMLPAVARASLFHGETLDMVANAMSWFVICVIPLAAIGAFLYVHVLPELIAERNQHPHKHSIKVLCILSLFFGGLLWPLAWLWAYTKPIGYRAVYGTEKHEDYYVEMGEKARRGALPPEEVDQLRLELVGMSDKGVLAPRLKRVLEELQGVPAPVPAPTPPRKGREAQPVAVGDE
jgi:hypothetical protein